MVETMVGWLVAHSDEISADYLVNLMVAKMVGRRALIMAEKRVVM